MAEDYAIIETGGKQYRAEKGATLLVERLPDDEGAKVNLRAVMFRADKGVVVEPKELDKVKVEATVAEHLRGPKLRIIKHRPKKGYRRRAGHRQGLTKLEVTEVKMLTRKPAAKKPAAKSASTSKKPADAGAKSAAGAKKPADAGAKKPAATRSAAKKSASSSAQKPAARKTSTRTTKKEGS
jgi:large subunit ribosomal protein L21